jgi:hypothetical protein
MAKPGNTETLAAVTAALALPTFDERRAATLALAAQAAHQELDRRLDRRETETRSALSRRQGMAESGLGQSSLISLEQSGALFSFLDGRKRLISADSFHAYLIARIIRAHPAGAEPAKGAGASTKFRSREGASTSPAS